MNLQSVYRLLDRKSVDTHSFQELYDRYYTKVYAYALQVTCSRERAEDITQDVFVKMWERGNLREIADMDAFLRVVTRNITLKMIRRTVIERKTMENMRVSWEEEDTSTEDYIDYKDTGWLLHEAIDRMPRQRRLVYRLCKEEGFQYAEVAQQMNLSLSSVKTHMLLALRSIREYLKKYDNEGLLVICSGVLIELFFR